MLICRRLFCAPLCCRPALHNSAATTCFPHAALPASARPRPRPPPARPARREAQAPNRPVHLHVPRHRLDLRPRWRAAAPSPPPHLSLARPPQSLLHHRLSLTPSPRPAPPPHADVSAIGHLTSIRIGVAMDLTGPDAVDAWNCLRVLVKADGLELPDGKYDCCAWIGPRDEFREARSPGGWGWQGRGPLACWPAARRAGRAWLLRQEGTLRAQRISLFEASPSLRRAGEEGPRGAAAGIRRLRGAPPRLRRGPPRAARGGAGAPEGPRRVPGGAPPQDRGEGRRQDRADVVLARAAARPVVQAGADPSSDTRRPRSARPAQLECVWPVGGPPARPAGAGL